MKKLTIFIILVAFNANTYAQENNILNAESWSNFTKQEGDFWQIEWNENSVPRMIFGALSKPRAGAPIEIALAFLKENEELFRIETSDLKHKKTFKTDGVSHITFQQYFKGIPVYDAQYKVHITDAGQVDMINGNYYPSIDISVSTRRSDQNVISIIQNDLNVNSISKNNKELNLVVYPISDTTFTLAYNAFVTIENSLGNWEYVIDATDFEILEKKNLVHQVAENLTGTGGVYLTHPDDDPSVVTVNLYGLNGSGYLNGTYVEVFNDDYDEAYSITNNFSYGPTTIHFDEVNLYYHVDRFRRNYVEALDFGNNIPLKAKAIARSNDPICAPRNSACYKYPDELHFPEVYPFAKEDKVIYHEYAHFILGSINNQIQATDANDEEGGIVEGLAVFFAGDFTARTEILNYAHHPAERDMINPDYSHYDDLPVDFNGNYLVPVHKGGEFLSSILWDIRAQIPDIEYNIFDSQFRLSSDPNFIELRNAMLTEAGTNQKKITIMNAFGTKGVGGFASPNLSISGLSTVSSGSSNTWLGVTSYAATPITYTWYTQPSGSSYWYNGGSGTSYDDNGDISMTTSQSSNFTLRLDITDAHGKSTSSQ